MGTLIRVLFLLSLLLIAACGGGSSAPEDTGPPEDVDEATASLWSSWADDAQQIGSLLAQMYNSGGLAPERTAELQGQARTLATEIRDGEPSSQSVADLADDLDQVAEDLDFGLEYARNAGLPVIRIRIPGFRESLQKLLDDSSAISQAFTTPTP